MGEVIWKFLGKTCRTDFKVSRAGFQNLVICENTTKITQSSHSIFLPYNKPCITINIFPPYLFLSQPIVNTESILGFYLFSAFRLTLVSLSRIYILQIVFKKNKNSTSQYLDMTKQL